MRGFHFLKTVLYSWSEVFLQHVSFSRNCLHIFLYTMPAAHRGLKMKVIYLQVYNRHKADYKPLLKNLEKSGSVSITHWLFCKAYIRYKETQGKWEKKQSFTCIGKNLWSRHSRKAVCRSFKIVYRWHFFLLKHKHQPSGIVCEQIMYRRVKLGPCSQACDILFLCSWEH